MNIKQHIPNLLTLLNLFCGCFLIISTIDDSSLSIEHTLYGEKYSTVYSLMFILFISLTADLLDGMVARWLNVASPIGLQLDSLADMVTFGVFPGLLMMKMLTQLNFNFAFLGLAITLFSALRLAKFNVDTTQTSYFKGLATPANTILILGIYILFISYKDFFYENGFYLLLIATIISCCLLIANIPLFSFKLKSFKIKDILPQILLLVISIILLIILGLKALAPIILVYIILSIIFRKTFAHA